MKFKSFIFAVVSFLFLFMVANAEATDDFQYWSQYTFKLVDTEKVDLSLFTELRLYDNASEDGLHLIAPRVTYDFWKYLKLGTNYTYISYLSGNEMKYQHRAEVEINPQFPLGDFAMFKNRNRVEFRWIEDKGSYNTRSRHRFGISVPLKSKKWLKSFYVNSEFFYNWAENAFDENRSVPLGLTFDVHEKVDLNVFYMIQSRNPDNNWSANQVLGTHAVIKF